MNSRDVTSIEEQGQASACSGGRTVGRHDALTSSGGHANASAAVSRGVSAGERGGPARVSYSRLTGAARDTIRWAFEGASIAGYVRWSGWADRDWHGDRCGCHDDRCIGYHHDEDEECGCLPVHLEQWWLETAAPVVHYVDLVCDQDCALEWHRTPTRELGPYARSTASQVRDTWVSQSHTATIREVAR